jgi:hypothetical protein
MEISRTVSDASPHRSQQSKPRAITTIKDGPNGPFFAALHASARPETLRELDPMSMEYAKGDRDDNHS